MPTRSQSAMPLFAYLYACIKRSCKLIKNPVVQDCTRDTQLNKQLWLHFLSVLHFQIYLFLFIYLFSTGCVSTSEKASSLQHHHVSSSESDPTERVSGDSAAETAAAQVQLPGQETSQGIASKQSSHPEHKGQSAGFASIRLKSAQLSILPRTCR